MVEILKNPALDNVIKLVSDSNEMITLCAPYVKESIIKEIIKNKKKDTTIKLITVLSLPNFLSNSSDIEALELMIENKFQVYNHTRLHAKTYIFDNTKAVITSGNLTYGGLIKNFEYGLVLSDQELVDNISNDFDKLLNNDDLLTLKDIDNVKEIISKTPKTKKNVIVMDEELLLEKNCAHEIANTLTGWEKEIFSIVSNINANEFEVDDVYKHKDTLIKKYPNNNNVEAKIRQQLQFLRNKGLIMFVSPGVYKKLWE